MDAGRGRSQLRVVIHQLNVGIQAAAAGDVLDLGQQEGRGGLAVDALLLGLLHGLINGLIDDIGVHGVLLGDGVRHQHAAAQAQLTLDMERLGQLGGRSH